VAPFREDGLVESLDGQAVEFFRLVINGSPYQEAWTPWGRVGAMIPESFPSSSHITSAISVRASR
jgi:hypothetical protein